MASRQSWLATGQERTESTCVFMCVWLSTENWKVLNELKSQEHFVVLKFSLYFLLRNIFTKIKCSFESWFNAS
jgi:hypothetical protein